MIFLVTHYEVLGLIESILRDRRHAGYSYSGANAAFAYSCIDTEAMLVTSPTQLNPFEADTIFLCFQ